MSRRPGRPKLDWVIESYGDACSFLNGQGVNLTLQILTIYGRSKNMLFSENFKTIELLTCQGFGLSRYFVWYSFLSESTVLQFFFFKAISLNLKRCKRIWLATCSSSLCFGGSSVLGRKKNFIIIYIFCSS